MSRLSSLTAFALIAAGAAAALFELRADPARGWTSLLVCAFLFLSLALAGQVFLAMQYASSAGWWIAFRRVPEALMSLVPLAALPMLAVWLGRHALYSWTRPGALESDPVLKAKSAWLNEPFFLGRMLFFLALWSLFSVLLRRASLAQDREPGLARHSQMVRLSAIFLVLFALTFSLASFDWLMSLQPRWTSTMFAIYMFAGLFQAGIAAIALAVARLSRGGLAGSITASHLHDLGKLLFAFSVFWAYIWVCQYLLIWYGNLSEEIPYYAVRTRGAWLPLFALAPVLRWLAPFLVLLSRWAKRDPKVLAGTARVVLAGSWLDLYMNVAPAVLPGPRLGAPELLTAAGFAALLWLAATRALASAPLLPRNDPFLGESLRHGA
ncbi:MAG: hypothetical protein ACJ76N_30105 [Thermoanaerobaculia bacterium]